MNETCVAIEWNGTRWVSCDLPAWQTVPHRIGPVHVCHRHAMVLEANAPHVALPRFEDIPSAPYGRASLAMKEAETAFARAYVALMDFSIACRNLGTDLAKLDR